MKLIVNQKELNIGSDKLTVAELLDELGSNKPGIAVAVNDKVVRKTAWGTATLAEGDHVTVITAVCGG